MSQSTEHDVTTFDQVRLAVIQNGLVGISREMGAIMERASYSAILNEGKDFSCAIFNTDGELVAEGEFVLVHLAAMHEAVQVLIKHFGATWRPGDIAVHNDPYEGGSHLPDINLVRPVFIDERVVAYVATRAHYPDVGGTVPGSFSGEATSLYHEGVVIPPLLLAREDVLDEQLISLWARNVRVARRLRADLLAQVASVRVGERSFHELCERFGVGTVEEVLQEIPEYGEMVMRGRIKARVRGESEMYDFMDDAGPDSNPVFLHLHVSAADGELRFDYTGSAPQVPCPINAPPAVVKSATYGAVKCMLVPELPLNSGMFRPLEVVTREGTVTHPIAPAPVAAGNTNTSQRLLDMCLATLGRMGTDGASGGMAGSYSANSDIGVGGYDERTGEEFVLYMMPVGGIGARPDLDGESALINYMGNCSSQPVEVWESMYPLRVTEYRLREGSGGPGRRRGGLGLCVGYEALEEAIQISIFTERQRFAPFGLEGGQPAEMGSYWITQGDQRTRIPTKTSGLWLGTHDRVEVSTAGGGGFGDPFLREPELVAHDVLEGLISPDSAVREYKVVLSERGDVDLTATEALRTSERDERPTSSLNVGAIQGDDAPEVLLSGECAESLGLSAGQILYVFTPDASAYAYACVEAGSDNKITLSPLVARVLNVAVGDVVTLRSLPTSWDAVSTDALRRQFRAGRTNEGE